MKPKSAVAPTRKQKLVLRLMILIGLACSVFFLYTLFKWQVASYKPLYWLLISTFLYTIFKIFYEWYHYWSISVPAPRQTTKKYTVDIFTTFCAGEPYEMIVETLTAIQAITYPHEAYLCDEADDPYLRSVCERLGVHHVTRKEKKDAKAGNINNALRRSKGELCVVLDPDHIPVPEFLDPIVAHFDDPEIGYVQVVQAYYNQDTGYVAKGAAQQTYQFYGPMMMSMNTYGTAQAIGANCTFRRTALESIGGHAAGLAEDMHTAMQIHAKGWKSIYLPMVLTRGLVPATLSAYYKQQLKWSRGVFELLFTTYPKLFSKFTWRQKLHYGLLPMFYLSGFVFLINFSLPIISLFTGIFPLRMDFSDFMVISIPLVTSVVLIRHYVQQWVMGDDELGFHVVGGLLLIGSWWVFIVGFVYTIIRKKVPYIPTPKDVKDEKTLSVNLPNIYVGLASLIAIVYALYTDYNPYSLFMAGIAALNCGFMLFMLVAGQELKLKAFAHRHARFARFAYKIKYLKGLFWLFRRRIYHGFRTAGIMVVILTVCICLNVLTGAGGSLLRGSAVVEALASWTSKLPIRTKRPFVTADQVKAFHSKNRQTASIMPAGGLTDNGITPNYFKDVRGVVYRKGNYWYKNIYPLNKKIIAGDFADMKIAGVNRVKIYGPTVYDRATLAVAADQHMGIAYSFWITDAYNFISDARQLDDLTGTIIKTVRKYKDNPVIKSWNLGNTPYQQLAYYYHGINGDVARSNYIAWLKNLVAVIKHEDSSRPLTVDVSGTWATRETIARLHSEVPAIDAFGVVAKDQYALKGNLKGIRANYFLSEAEPNAFAKDDFPPGGVFYANWQDQETSWAITLNGLKDIWGRNKPRLAKISKKWSGQVAANNIPYIRILQPALTTVPGDPITYNALVYQYNKWNLAPYYQSGLKFEWYLVSTDSRGNPNALYWAGNEAMVSIKTPANPENYRLYLIATKGNNIAEAYCTLNLPLVKSRQSTQNVTSIAKN